jgi:hypothetical protein
LPVEERESRSPKKRGLRSTSRKTKLLPAIIDD